MEGTSYQQSNNTNGMWGLLINGNSGAGKTTISRKLEQRLQEIGLPAVHIPFDKERHKFAQEGKYNYTDNTARIKTYENAAQHYAEMIKEGEIPLIDTGARSDDTRRPLLEIPGIYFVHLECPLHELIKRETLRSITGENKEFQRGKFLYIKAIASLPLPESLRFSQPGITVPYDEPKIEPHLRISTHKTSVDNVVLVIMNYLRDKRLIPNS